MPFHPISQLSNRNASDALLSFSGAPAPIIYHIALEILGAARLFRFEFDWFGWGRNARFCPLAGTSIINRAQVSFVSEGQAVRLDTNAVNVIVLPLEDLQLTQDNTLNSATGAPVSLPHRLTNTGNVAASYTLEARNAGATITIYPI